MKLKYQLFFSYICIGLVPLLIISFLTVQKASSTIKEQAYDQLTSIRSIKQKQVENYFAETKADIHILKSTLAEIVDFSTKENLSISAHLHHPMFKEFIEVNGYYDMFLIDPNGSVFYTVAKEADYQTNLVHGLYKNSGLGKLFEKTRQEKLFQIVDFEPYEPSNNEPASFIAVPLLDESKQIVMIVALQLSIDRINQIMRQREGMGQTGETYLVGQDLRMRSDSFLDPTGHSVLASFAGSIDKNGVNTQATQEAFQGVIGTKIIIDYNGNPVLSAYTKLDIPGLNWVLLAEIDEAEAMAPVQVLQNWIIAGLLVTVIAVVAITVFISKLILTPLGGEPVDMYVLTERIAAGDLSMQFSQQQSLTGVYGAMHKMSTNLRQLISTIIDTSGQLSSAAAQTSATSEQTTVSLGQQQSSIETVSSAMYEMTVTIESVAEDAQHVADATAVASELSRGANNSVMETIKSIRLLETDVEKATAAINDMVGYSNNIASVLEVINGIAEQTNLLALNAAIEAARAGEQGRGFAVVADEVRQLAQKTQDSTQHIERMVKQLKLGSQNAVEVMKTGAGSTQSTVYNAQLTSEAINATNEKIQSIAVHAMQIATAAVEQSQTAEDICQNLVAINDTATENATGAHQTAQASQQLSCLALELNKITTRFSIA